MQEKRLQEIQTQGKCGPLKELVTAGRRMTHSTKVSRRREHDRKRYNQDSVVQETQKGQTFGRDVGRVQNATLA
jgi:hypothetical protein